ncbi:MAG TPA: DUF202 domain-containing protein [Allosphingosinicella sp.]
MAEDPALRGSREDVQLVFSADRTILAYERTYAAWLRTGLAALGGGIGAQALVGGRIPAWSMELVSAALLALAVFCFAAGIWCDRKYFGAQAQSASRTVPQPLLRAVNILLILLTLTLVAGFWSS